MDITLKLTNKAFITRCLLTVILLFFLLVILFSIFYLSHGYNHLAGWFTGLNDCFYRKATWTTNFFTLKTREAGNLYCMVSLILSVIGGWYCIQRFKAVKKNHSSGTTLKVPVADIFFGALLPIIGTGLWYWATSLVYPSNDEVFSAVNCAELHPFQTAAYYMLPNNHIFFNLVNNLLFHWSADKVASGRLLSLFCYWGAISLFYRWLISVLPYRWLAFIAAITLALQFPVWGFASQARGYEMILFCGWIAFISIFRYYTYAHKSSLITLALACVAGYFTMPSFLYFHLALMIYAFFSQLHSRKSDLRFWKYQAAMVAVVFMLYLPCLCFSGSGAITGNQYVLAHQDNQTFIADSLSLFWNYMDYFFFNFITSGHQVDLVLFLLPITLIFFRKNILARQLGWFYIALWGSVLVLAIPMRLFPFDRTLTGQFSIALAIVLFTVYTLLVALFKKFKAVRLPSLLLTFLLLGMSVNFVIKGFLHINHYLCHFPANGWHDLLMNEGVRKIPEGSSVSFSGESFYLYYLCSQKNLGYRASKCRNGNEDFFINLNEPFPPGIAEGYTYFNKVGDFFIYKKK